MATTKNSTAAATKVATSKVLSELTISSETIETLLEKGVLRNEYLTLNDGFANRYAVDGMPAQEVKAFKGEGKVLIPKYRFHNDNRNVVVWGTTLLNALVCLYSLRIHSWISTKASGRCRTTGMRTMVLISMTHTLL
jgi:hypothetical protein